MKMSRHHPARRPESPKKILRVGDGGATASEESDGCAGSWVVCRSSDFVFTAIPRRPDYIRCEGRDSSNGHRGAKFILSNCGCRATPETLHICSAPSAAGSYTGR